ncbi:MAG: hypothetical protein IPK82_41190 [Polyangiaceae bacterium]|nr:hypothetical protein [Polyangiaceae bacterium]
MDLHDVARQVAQSSGADFAFVLSQAGLLVTHDAPKDMPDRGRMKILWACPKGKNGEVVHLEMPREDLVPFGGAAPIDVFAIRVEDTAVLVAAMATWNNKGTVILALTEGAAALGEMILRAKKARAQKAKKPSESGKKASIENVQSEPRKERITLPYDSGRRPNTLVPGRKERTSTVPAEPARKERTSIAPAGSKRDRNTLVGVAKRERTSTLPKAPKEAPAKRAARPPSHSQPEIEVTEVAVGRETMLALEPYRPNVRPSSSPEITLGEAVVGRETLIAIDAASLPSKPGPSPEAVRVELDSISRESMLEVERMEASQRGRPTVEEPLVTERRTLPWVDTPASLKSTLEARAKARAAEPPEVKLRVEELDAELLETSAREGPNKR